MSDDDSDRFRGGGLNPLNFPHRLKQYRKRDPDGDDAREVHDPHKWEDPDPSLRERLSPNTIAGWMAAGVVFLIVGGLTFYLAPIFGPAFRNELLLIAIAIISFLVLYYLWARHQGFKAANRFAKSIVYYGDDVDARVGEYQGSDGRSHLFTPYVNVSYGGFNARELKKRDLPFSPAKLRSNIGRKDEIGEEAVVDRLNQTTAKVETETLGTVLVTHAAGMEFDEFGNESDRHTTRPQTIDEDIARQMDDLIRSLERSSSSLRKQVELLENRMKELQETRKVAIVDELNGAINLMDRMADLAAKQRQHPSRREVEGPGASIHLNGEGPVERLDREIAEEFEEERRR